MSVIKKEIKRKFLYRSAYIYKVSEHWFFWGVEGSAGDINLPLEPAFFVKITHILIVKRMHKGTL